MAARSLGGFGLRAIGGKASEFGNVGLTGMQPSRNPREELRLVYQRTLKTLEKMPDDSAYRKYTGSIITDRLKAVLEEKDVGKLERRINSGMIEEVIVQAKYELDLARRLVEIRPWEPLIALPTPSQWKWPI